MKKALVGITFLLLFLCALVGGVLWNAMVQMNHEVVADNIYRAKQEVHFNHVQLRLDTGDVEYTTHWLSPETIIHKPVLTLTSSQGVYHISLETLRVRGSLWQYHQVELVPSDVVMVNNANEKGEHYKVAFSSIPKIEIRGKKPDEETSKTELLFYNDYRVEVAKSLMMETIKGEAETGNKRPVDTSIFSDEWSYLEFRFYPYVLKFIQLVTAPATP